MKRIAYTRPDGGVSVVVPSPNFVAQFDTEAQAIAFIQVKDVPSDASTISVIDVTDIPSDRTFRNAWEQTAPGVIDINMPKARDIHAGQIARAQIAEIARLKVEERKERLRGNTTQADSHAATTLALDALDLNVLATQIFAAPTPTVLKAVWPALIPR